MNKLEITKDSFLLNGEPFRIVSGAMHYFRVPREYWRDRLLKIKACGFNTVETYTAWNLHEPVEGQFDFSGNLDLDAYLSLIEELGMLAIVRPGPYICSEWEFGGLPWWLLRYDDIELRCMNETYISKVNSYFDALIPVVAKHQADCGGCVVMVQVENEYGSYGNDSVYIRYLADALRNRGITCSLFTSDGGCDTMLSGGTVPEIFKTVNFGSKAKQNFKALKSFGHEGPLMCAEFWNGWFDHWGEKHHTRDASDAAGTLDEILSLGAGVSAYMMHGGTNFGYMNGANCSDGEYQPTVNSYDYDSPINEYGGLTPKYYEFQKVLRKYGFENAVETENPVTAGYGSVEFTECADLIDSIPMISAGTETVTPLNTEKLGQGYGFTYYKTFVKGPKDKDELIFVPHDRAYVFADGKFIGCCYRNDKKSGIHLSVPEKGIELGILVENMGRVNYGPALADKKGIIGGVRLGGQNLYHWTTYCLPFFSAPAVKYVAEKKTTAFEKRPQFLKGVFNVQGEPNDTFINTSNFRKGIIFINGRLLSRYWHEGPQKTSYIPASWLKTGENTVELLELEGYRKPVADIQGNPEL